MKVYVVTFDGYTRMHGSQVYLLGVYSSREAADMAAADVPEDDDESVVTIREVELNDTAEILYYGGTGYGTQHYLGGYDE